MDPLRPVSPGDVFEDRLGSASMVNAMLDAIRPARNNRRHEGAPPPPDTLTPQVTVLVKNNSGGNLDRGAVVYADNFEVSPLTLPYDAQRRPALRVTTPADGNTDQPLVLLEPIPASQYGRAAVSGVVVAKVEVNSTSHPFARAIAGDATKFRSDWTGPARILTGEAGTGDRMKYVMLGIWPRPVKHCVLIHSANQSIASGAAPGTVLTWDTEGDRGDFHNNVNPTRLTIPHRGAYIFGASIVWAANAVGSRNAELWANGTATGTFLANTRVMNAGAGDTVTCVLSHLRTLSAGDYIEVFAAQNSGGNLNVLGPTGLSSFWIAELGWAS